MNELKPCPFCGSNEIELKIRDCDKVFIGDVPGYETAVGCDGCGIVCGIIGYIGYNEENSKERREVAIQHTVERWNIRTSIDVCLVPKGIKDEL